MVEEAIANIDNEVEETRRAEERALRVKEDLDEIILRNLESSGASGLAVQVHLLRSRADALETMDIYEAMRQRLSKEKLQSLESAQDFIQRKLQRN